jgi:hypothetical protein
MMFLHEFERWTSRPITILTAQGNVKIGGRIAGVGLDLAWTCLLDQM